MKWQWFLDIIFPTACVSCKTPLDEGAMACEECLKKIELRRTFFCPSCHARLPTARNTCHGPAWYRLGAAAGYDDPTVASLVKALKFDFARSAAQPLAGLLVSYVGQLQLQLEKPLVVPVPLGKKRLRERGFNQSHLIAETFAHALQLPYAPHVMARTRNTPPQSKSETFKGRFQNVAGCFEVKDANAVRGSDVLLVDDVTTSGATFKEASLALKSAGARSVTALAVAMAGQ